MRHDITVLLHNTLSLTKSEVYELLVNAECNEGGCTFDIFMMSDYIKIEFSRYGSSQDAVLIDILEDLEFMGLRNLLSTIELEVYK